MKIILSHDIDHLYWSEHLFRDFYIPKYIAKTFWFGLKGKISKPTMKSRINALKKNRIHRINELSAFNKQNKIPATFFIGMSNGLSLSYSYASAAKIAGYLRNEGFDTGVHGIAYEDRIKMKIEYDRFSKFVHTEYGIRNHYLRKSPSTLKIQSELGYLYGSTSYALSPPFKVGKMWEFPISVMESYIARPHQLNSEKMKNKTLKLVEEAINKKLPYFVINFHDPHFDAITTPEYKDWYVFLIEYFKSNEYEFTNFKDAVVELETNITI